MVVFTEMGDTGSPSALSWETQEPEFKYVDLCFCAVLSMSKGIMTGDVIFKISPNVEILLLS